LVSTACARPEIPATKAVVTAMRFIIENVPLMSVPLSNEKLIS
jgi:hypothetical protein